MGETKHMLKAISRRALSLWSLGLMAAAHKAAWATEDAKSIKVAGYDFNETAVVAGQTLVLNGAGVSNILSSRATAVGFYLPKKTQDIPTALNMPGPKRVHIVFLRELSSRDLANSLSDRLRQNAAPGEVEANILQIAALGGTFGASTRVAKGSVATIDYLPASKSTETRINGERTSEPIVGDKYFALLMKVWVGPRIRAGTRDALMGLESTN